jgi:hypothetical protein
MITFRAHLASRPTFLARLNYGDNNHILIDGGAGLNVISYAAFKQLQILESKLDLSRPFSGVGPHPVYPVGTISVPVMFRTLENIRIENVQFDVMEVNIP